MSQCGFCKMEHTCKYKDKVLQMHEDMYPLKIECKFFKHFLEAPHQELENNNEKKKRKFLW